MRLKKFLGYDAQDCRAKLRWQTYLKEQSCDWCLPGAMNNWQERWKATLARGSKCLSFQCQRRVREQGTQRFMLYREESFPHAHVVDTCRTLEEHINVITFWSISRQPVSQYHQCQELQTNRNLLKIQNGTPKCYTPCMSILLDDLKDFISTAIACMLFCSYLPAKNVAPLVAPNVETATSRGII